MRIQNNIMAMNTHRMYTNNNSAVSKSAEKLSSGYRINRAGDDAAGLAISEKMRSQIRGLNMASKNSQDAISLVQTAEGALQEVHSMLQRMNELAVQSATGTNENFDRSQLDAEFNQLVEEIDQVAVTTNFNNMKLLDGTLGGFAQSVKFNEDTAVPANNTLDIDLSKMNVMTGTGVKIGDTTYRFAVNGESISDLKDGEIQVDVADTKVATVSAGLATAVAANPTASEQYALTTTGNTLTVAKGAGTADVASDTVENKYGGLSIQIGAEQGNLLYIQIDAMSSSVLGLNGQGIGTQAKAGDAISATRSAISVVSEQRSVLGAMQNRLEHKISNLDNTAENLQAAESRIRDCDIAKEMTNYTKNNILSQAATAMLAQANSSPQNVLSLLQ